MQFKDGLYEVSMPWKSDLDKLPENYAAGYKRLMSTEKLTRNKGQRKTYKNIIDSYMKKGDVRKVSNQENDKRWYLLHFAAEKPDKKQQKLE